MDREELRRKQVLYTLPGMERARIQKNLTYKTPDDGPLYMDIYSPPDMPAGARLPAVIFVSGDAPPEYTRGVKDSGQYVSWGQLITALGMIAVTFDHRSPHPSPNWYSMLAEVASDVNDALAYIRSHAEEWSIDTGQLAIWTCSGGPPYALSDVLREPPAVLRCIISYYGMMNLAHLSDETDPPALVELLHRYSTIEHLKHHPEALPPMLITRAGLDRPRLNESIDAFVAEALRLNLPIDLMNHPKGHHSFDVLDDDERTREIIQHTLAFLKRHLRADEAPKAGAGPTQHPTEQFQAIIYTDGACLKNPGPGGYGVVLLYDGQRRELSGGFRKTTNNRMEILAAIEGLKALKQRSKVLLYSDSQYLVNAMQQDWAKRWRANGWMRGKGQPAINPDLWEQLLTLTAQHDVTFAWVRGHAGNKENERCDFLSVQAAKGKNLPVDAGYERAAAKDPTLFDQL